MFLVMQEPDSPSGYKNLCQASGNSIDKLLRNTRRVQEPLRGELRSQGCPAISSDLASVVCLLSRMAITNDLPSVFRVPGQKLFGCWVSQMASSHISCSIKNFSDK